MPELPEVETLVRQFSPRLVGRTARRLEIMDAKLAVVAPERVRGRRIVDVRRVGKQIAIGLAPAGKRRASLWICIHLRMTGRLLMLKRGRSRPRTRARLRLDRGSLVFSDLRRFGTLRLVESPSEIETGGLEPLSPELTARRLEGLLSGSAQEIKPWLLRQDRLVGLGNIYASEILFAARIHPRLRAGSLDAQEVRRLHRSMRRILRRAIKQCGTTFSDFRDADGLSGSFQNFLAVYRRAGEPCPRCRRPIARLVQQQRGTFFCPRCQPA